MAGASTCRSADACYCCKRVGQRLRRPLSYAVELELVSQIEHVVHLDRAVAHRALERAVTGQQSLAAPNGPTSALAVQPLDCRGLKVVISLGSCVAADLSSACFAVVLAGMSAAGAITLDREQARRP